MVCSSVTSAADVRTRQLTDSLRKALGTVRTPSVRISILYDIFDLCDSNLHESLGLELIDVARRSDNGAIAFVEVQREVGKALGEYVKTPTDDAYAGLEMSEQSARLARDKIICVSLIGVLVFAVILFMLHRYYIRVIHRAAALSKENAVLKKKIRLLKRINDELERITYNTPSGK